MDGLKLEGSIEAVESAGNLIFADFGVGLGDDKFVGFDGNRNSDPTMLGSCVAECDQYIRKY